MGGGRGAIGVAVAVGVLAACALVRPMAPQYTAGSAVIEELRAPGVDAPVEPLALRQGSFIDDASDEARGGAGAIYGDRDGWQVRLERFGVPGEVGTLVIQPPPGTDGVNPAMAGSVGAECVADLRGADAAGFAGTITCERMRSELPGARRGIRARITFEARP